MKMQRNRESQNNLEKEDKMGQISLSDSKTYYIANNQDCDIRGMLDTDNRTEDPEWYPHRHAQLMLDQ